MKTYLLAIPLRVFACVIIFLAEDNNKNALVGKMDKLLFNIHDVVLLMTAYQCTLFALLILVIKRARPLSSCILAAFLVAQAAIPLDILINFGAGFREWAIQLSPNIFFVFGMAYWLEGPLLLWYTRSLIYKNYRFTTKDLIYLLPLLLYALHQFVTFYNQDHAVKVASLESHTLIEESVLTHLIGLAREVLRVTFCVMSLLAIRDFRKQIKDEYSSIEKIDFAWLKFLVVAFLIISCWAVLVSLSIVFSAHFDFRINYELMGLSANYCVFVLVSAMIFFSINYSSMFEGVDRQETVEEEAPQEQVDMALVEKIERYMEEHKPHLNSLLSLERLSNQMEISARALSKTINRHYGKNFFEFINGYRIEESKRRLSNPDFAHQTILEVMMDSGFNSKATYNTFFKKLVSMTPSEYRRQNLKN